MDLTVSAADRAFRADVRAFVAQAMPPDKAALWGSGYPPDRAAALGWTRILATRGWSVPHWPVEYGGTGWTPLRRAIFEEECCLGGAPIVNLQGTDLVGPVIYTFGSEAQKQRFLPGIREGREYWCQGFSEPNAGSDLANLRTRAVRDGDHYLVNGQKIWTSQAQYADWLFLLVRTDPDAKPQRGISFLLVDMQAPGITIRPIISIDGCHHLNEVFFDDVRVPVENLVGAENRGWDYSKFLLGNERAFSGAGIPVLKRTLARIKHLARGTLLRDPAFAARLARLEHEVLAIEMSVLRVIHEDPGTSTGGWAIGSILKVRGTELQQQASAMLLELAGPYGAVFYPDGYESVPGDQSPRVGPDHVPGLFPDLVYKRATSIAGGTNEIQRNIIAKMVLGL